MSDVELLAVVREPDATWVIPSDDEWYGAAYHKNAGVTENYFEYPMGGDSVPSNALVEPTDPGTNATFFDVLGHKIVSQYWRTEVGAQDNSDGPYGPFDQGGPVAEWNEAILYGTSRGLRVGSFVADYGFPPRALRGSKGYPPSSTASFGFRVAEIPEPGRNIPTLPEWGLVAMTLLVLTAGTLMWVGRLQLARSPREVNDLHGVQILQDALDRASATDQSSKPETPVLC